LDTEQVKDPSEASLSQRRLHGYDETDIRRIRALACRLVESKVTKGEIELTDEAIRAAMPEAIEAARQAVTAVNEFLCG